MMKKSIVYFVLFWALMPISLCAQSTTSGVEKFEFGVQVGASFTWANGLSMPNVIREPEFAWKSGVPEFPMFETFGAVLRYRIDERWAVQLQGMRHRYSFKETAENVQNVYYNAMWNVDAMAEFNVVKYTFISQKKKRSYELAPYIALGVGASMYNKTANYSYGTLYALVQKYEDNYDVYERKSICVNNVPKNSYRPIDAKNMAFAMYVPIAIGAKLRMTTNWQLKLACQYNLYVWSPDKMDLYGATQYVNEDTKFAVFQEDVNGFIKKKSGTKHYNLPEDAKFHDGVKYDNLTNKFGKNHNLMVTLGVIFNFNASYQGRLME